MKIQRLDSLSKVKEKVLMGKIDTLFYDWLVDFSYREVEEKKYRLPFAVPCPIDNKPETFVAMLTDLLAKGHLKSSYGELYQYGISLYFRRAIEKNLSASDGKRKAKLLKDLSEGLSPEVWALVKAELESKQEIAENVLYCVSEDLYREMEENRVLEMRVRNLIPQAIPQAK